MRLALREARRGIGPDKPESAGRSGGGAVWKSGWEPGGTAGPGAARGDRGDRGGRRTGEGARCHRLHHSRTGVRPAGRTPPCVDALIAADVRRVVWAVDDPNPTHAGRARTRLRRAGIESERGVGAAAAGGLIGPWAKWIMTGMPWVIAKAGVSLDGRITRPRGEGQWLTGEPARADAMRLRRRADAVVVGAGTLRADDPALTLRPGVPGKVQPWRVVLTNSGELPSGARLFTDAHRERTLVLRGQPIGACCANSARAVSSRC